MLRTFFNTRVTLPAIIRLYVVGLSSARNAARKVHYVTRADINTLATTITFLRIYESRHGQIHIFDFGSSVSKADSGISDSTPLLFSISSYRRANGFEIA